MANDSSVRRSRAPTAQEAKARFAARLNDLCDEAGVPPKGENRQKEVGDLFGVSQKGARKWLEGVGMPTLAKAIGIAVHFNVQTEWLLSGRGDKRVIEKISPLHRSIIEKYDHAKPADRQIVKLALGLE
jgi:transcriptional regulator with XRE-family HTH domain